MWRGPDLLAISAGSRDERLRSSRLLLTAVNTYFPALEASMSAIGDPASSSIIARGRRRISAANSDGEKSSLYPGCSSLKKLFTAAALSAA